MENRNILVSGLRLLNPHCTSVHVIYVPGLFKCDVFDFYVCVCVQLVLEMCRGEHPVDMQTIQPHLDRIKAPISTAKDHHVSKHGVEVFWLSCWLIDSWLLSLLMPFLWFVCNRLPSTRWRNRRWTLWSWCIHYWRIPLKENTSSRYGTHSLMCCCTFYLAEREMFLFAPA